MKCLIPDGAPSCLAAATGPHHSPHASRQGSSCRVCIAPDGSWLLLHAATSILVGGQEFVIVMSTRCWKRWWSISWLSSGLLPVSPLNTEWMVEHGDASLVSVHFTNRRSPSLIHWSLPSLVVGAPTLLCLYVPQAPNHRF